MGELESHDDATVDMGRTGKTQKSRIVGSHTTTDARFLVTKAYQHRIKRIRVLAPLPESVSWPADERLISSDIVLDQTTSDCPAGLKIKHKAKRYANSVRISSLK